MKNLQYQILEYLYSSNGAFFIDTANHFISSGENPSDVSDMIRLLIDQKHITASAKDTLAAYLKLSPSGKAKLFEYQSAHKLGKKPESNKNKPDAGVERPYLRFFRKAKEFLSVTSNLVTVIGGVVTFIFFLIAHFQ